MTEKSTVKETPKTSYKSLFTRSDANAGTRIDVPLPSGEESPYWFHILGKNSDLFREGKQEMMRFGLTLFDKTQEEREEAFKIASAKLIRDCIIDWNLDDEQGNKLELTDENKAEIFKQARQVEELVDESVGKQALFCKKK